MLRRAPLVVSIVPLCELHCAMSDTNAGGKGCCYGDAQTLVVGEPGLRFLSAYCRVGSCGTVRGSIAVGAMWDSKGGSIACK